jgi:hypothetical protein
MQPPLPHPVHARVNEADTAPNSPGRDDQLKTYWTRGEGLAKWADDPHPWTALYHHLVKYMEPERAKRTAAQWFHTVKGYWPGDQKGKNPVGPG